MYKHRDYRWRKAFPCGNKGREKVPAIIKNLNDTETASVALIENLQRRTNSNRGSCGISKAN